MSFLGLVRAIHTVSIKLAGTNSYNPHMPDITRAVAYRIKIDNSGRRCVGGMIKQLQPNAIGVTTE